MLVALVNGFPLWVLACGLLALWKPEFFTWFSGPLIPIGLGVIMLGMGLTLTLEDFRRVLTMPRQVLVGVLLQYTVMPALGLSLARLYHLPKPFAVGLILVSCCPGGTASNVVSFIAKADVPLSVTMTACSTVLAVVMTPILTGELAGAYVHVDRIGLLIDTLKVVVVPVFLGLAMNRLLPRLTRSLLPVAPLVAVLAITLIVASIIGASKSIILSSGLTLVAAVASLHAGGFLFGYALSRLMTGEEITARTVSIEVGMQNSGLGVVLARGSFANPAFAIPSAISSLFHSLIASMLAAVWRHSAEKYQETLVKSPRINGTNDG
ncbi:MAG: bile acid:sodium symporter family protein [Armatimonadetes bacterium]|nr:bile acid:sodium symporter family protein [Armatimonadota bacterium]